MRILIKEYKKSDKKRVLDLLKFNTPKYFSVDEEKDLIYYLDNQIEQYFVIENESKLIGCGGINYEDFNTIGIISWDIIHPDFQKKGVGSQLLKHRIEILKSVKELKAIKVRTSQLTNDYYAKLGFELIVIKKNYWAKGFDLYEMLLKL